MGYVINLPEWATFKLDDKGEPIRYGEALIIDAHAAAFYESFFTEYRVLYGKEEKLPGEFYDNETGKLKKEWKDALADLHSDTPSAYWCEVAYQSMKMELQICCRTPGLNILVQDTVKAHRQEDRPQKRDVKLAASAGFNGGREARQHFKRLRGFIPG